MPAQTKELLQAQATGGREGAKAYAAAAEQLKQQRAAAVERAMQEAALRGSPAGAMDSIQSQMTRPYDAEIATMTGAAATADQMAASREQRMADYNASVGAARGLIGDQVQQSVAPINAQSDFLIRQLEQQGANRVAELEGQLALEMARLEASLRGRGGGGGRRGGGGGGGGRQMGAERSIATVAGQARQDLQATVPQVQGMQRQTAEQNRQAANYTGRSVDQYNRQQSGRPEPTPTPRTAEERRFARLAPQAEVQGHLDRMPRAPSLAEQEAARQAAQYTGRGVAAAGTPTTPAAQWNAVMQPATANAQLQGIVDQRRQQSAGTLPGAQEWVAEGQELFNRAMGRPTPPPPLPPLSQAQQAFRPLNARRIALSNAPGYTSDVGFMTQQQLQQLSDTNPLGLAALAGGPLNRADQVAERLLGYGRMGPIGEFGTDAYGDGDPVAADAMQQAMLLAAERLIGQGYNLNEEAILNALSGGTDAGYQFGDTVAGQDARMNPEPEPEPGLLTAAQRQEIKDEDLLAGRDERLTEQQAQQQQQQFTAQTGLEVPSGVPVEVAAGAFNSDRDREIQAWVVQNAESMRRDNLSVRELLMFRGMADIGFDPADPFDYAILAMLEQRIGG